MTATFVGVRDGYLAARMGGREVFGSGGMPSYAVPDGTPVRQLGLGQLLADLGGNVERGGERTTFN